MKIYKKHSLIEVMIDKPVHMKIQKIKSNSKNHSESIIHQTRN